MHQVTSDFRMHELSNSLSVPVVLACFHDDASIAQLPNKNPTIDSKTLHAIRKVVRTHFAGPVELDLLCRQSDTLEVRPPDEILRRHPNPSDTISEPQMFTRETVQSINTQFPGTLQKLKVCELQSVVQPKFVEDHPPSNALDTSPAKGYSYKVHSRSALGKTGISVLVFIDHANCAHQRAWTRRARTGTM